MCMEEMALGYWACFFFLFLPTLTSYSGYRLPSATMENTLASSLLKYGWSRAGGECAFAGAFTIFVFVFSRRCTDGQTKKWLMAITLMRICQKTFMLSDCRMQTCFFFSFFAYMKGYMVADIILLLHSTSMSNIEWDVPKLLRDDEKQIFTTLFWTFSFSFRSESIKPRELKF